MHAAPTYRRGSPASGRRHRGIVVSAVLGSLLSCTPPVHPDDVAVREVVRMYLLADEEGDHRRLGQVLHARAETWYLREDGTLAVLTGAQVSGRRQVAPGPHRLRRGGDAPDLLRRTRILAVDVHGTAAMVKTELDWDGGRFIDYLTLLKLREGWRIVGSSSHWERDGARGG